MKRCEDCVWSVIGPAHQWAVCTHPANESDWDSWTIVKDTEAEKCNYYKEEE